MSDRTEPRFRTDAAGVVEVIRGEAHSLPARIADVSATGLQIETTEPLQEGETIRLTVDRHQMLGQVRRCTLHDSTYKIGVERVDPWDENVSADRATVLGRPALKNPAGSLRAAALRELFADPRLRVRTVKYQTILALAAAIALASWAGASALLRMLGHK